jgi:hypothetical protein
MPGLRIRARAIGQRCRALAIAEERELKLELLCKSPILLWRVEAGAENLDIALLVVILMVAEPASLQRSARRIGLRVKPQQHFSPPEIRQSNRSAVVRREAEIGCVIAGFNHRETLLSQSESFEHSRSGSAHRRFAPEARRASPAPPVQFRSERRCAIVRSMDMLVSASGANPSASSNCSIAFITIPLAAYSRPRLTYG